MSSAPERLSPIDQLRLVLAFLTRLPVGPRGTVPAGAMGRAAWAFPLAGAVVGLAGGLVFAGAAALGLPPWPAAGLAVGAEILLTGALHEDALSDLADGFGGGADREAKLAIMRDSRAGAYGVTALCLALILRTGALASLAAAGSGAVLGALVAAGALSRAAAAVALALLPAARSDGLGASQGAVPDRVVWLAVVLALVLAVLGTGWAAAGAVLGAGLGTAAVMVLAQRQIGGQTGDVLGTVQQAALILALFGLLLHG